MHWVGDELDAFLKEHGPYDRVIYVGDGSNDFCPVIRLREYAPFVNFNATNAQLLHAHRQDMILCRTYRGLQRRIEGEGGVRCQIKYWGGAWEVEEIFKEL